MMLCWTQKMDIVSLLPFSAGSTLTNIPFQLAGALLICMGWGHAVLFPVFINLLLKLCFSVPNSAAWLNCALFQGAALPRNA
jgi:hypothetical protein